MTNIIAAALTVTAAVLFVVFAVHVWAPLGYLAAAAVAAHFARNIAAAGAADDMA